VPVADQLLKDKTKSHFKSQEFYLNEKLEIIENAGEIGKAV
jgi:phage-related holin